ncbi:MULTISPECIES: LysR substrate-binding domain-containing protein [unclassified Flavobacterium]|uniref:LysR substrate-binding domain-containing protein n=1 Tax=unclassified Flavobacterium TaxID=196869 RepID=UPI0015703050|nr:MULTISPECIES: LysR substrate-binding domain-containing protein [unclassified Flavobacterium]MBE0390288.1 HTH-type transcriptional regulator CynR [Flavobacterium sp. PL002]NRT16217.1 LysR family cyn operon transcriptional activator [Flavobacterium sp. 28A]
MEIQQLNYFIKTAEVLHFTKAAELCFVTQSALSQQIKKLEEELGMPLFLRTGKKIQLTEAGTLFLKHAQQIVGDVQSGKQAIEDLNALIGGELRIGVTYIFGLLVLPVVQTFAKSYPKLKIIVEYGATEPLEQKLISNELDLVLVISANEIDSRIRKIPLFTSELVMAVAKTNPLAALTQIPFKKLEDIPLILPSQGFNSREFLDNLFEKNNMKPKIPIELNAIHPLLQIIENSEWATVVTEMALSGWHNIKAVKLEGVATERISYILTLNNEYQKKAINLFIAAFRKIL